MGWVRYTDRQRSCSRFEKVIRRRSIRSSPSRLRKFNLNCQAGQCWSTMAQGSVAALPVSHLKRPRYCLAMIWECLWPGHHSFPAWERTKKCSNLHEASGCEIIRSCPGTMWSAPVDDIPLVTETDLRRGQTNTHSRISLTTSLTEIDLRYKRLVQSLVCPLLK